MKRTEPHRYNGTPFLQDLAPVIALSMHFRAANGSSWVVVIPSVEIKSIDMTYGADKRGVPVLLAITAATAVR
jgi:hypothetical protein